MRKMVLWVIIISLLHTQVFYGAVEVIETQPATSLWQRCVDKVAFWRSSSGLTVDPIEQMESGVLVETKLPGYQESKPSLLAEYVDSVKSSVSAFINHPAGFCVLVVGGMCILFGATFVFLVSLVGFFDDLPLSVALTQITHPTLSSYQALDICQNFLVADTKYLEHVRSFSKYEHVSSRNGITFLDALPGWLNNAHNLLALFSAYILSERTMDRSQQAIPYKLQGDFSNLLFAYGVDMHNHNYMCSFSKGNNGRPDSITGCQLDSKKDLYESGVDFSDETDAVIQFRLWDNKYNFRHPFDLSVRISVNLTPLKKQLHPVLNYFPYLGQGEDISRFSVQRRLMQGGSSSGLPDAVKDRVENNLEVMGPLNAMLHKLRLWESVGENEAALLSTLVRSDFTTNQIALTSDIGCDLDLVNGLFKLLSCFQGNRPAIAEETTIPSAGQVWFLRESSGAVSQVVAIANKAPITEAMAVWLKQSTVAVSNLWEIADALYHRVCSITGDAPLNLLMNAAQNELVNHDAGLQKDLGCDIRFNDGDIKEMVCHSGTAPFVPEGCALESNVTVRWDGKLWLKHDRLKPSRVTWAAVSVNPVWHSSRSATHPYSPSLLASDKASASGTAITDTVELTDEVTRSGTAITDSDEVTRSGAAITDSDEVTRSGAAITDSDELTDEVTAESTASASITHSPSLHNAAPEDDGIAELYYVSRSIELGDGIRKVSFNGAHTFNDMMYIPNSEFGDKLPSWGVHVDKKRKRIYWTNTNVSIGGAGIYVADILSNPIKLNNTRTLYTSGADEMGALYVDEVTGSIFWRRGGKILLGGLNVTNPIRISSFSDIKSYINSGLGGIYFDAKTSTLLWIRQDAGIGYRIFKGTVNVTLRSLTNEAALFTSSSAIRALAYDTKHQKLLFSTLTNTGLYMAPYVFPSSTIYNPQYFLNGLAGSDYGMSFAND